MKSRYAIVCLFLLMTLFACTERVDFELDEAGEPLLVVFGEITNDTMAHEVRLSKSAPYFSNQAVEMVSNAELSLYDGVETIELAEDPERRGVYLTPVDYFGLVGREYRLDISNVDVNADGELETYWVETEMKPTAPVFGVAVVYNVSWEGWEVGVFSEDNPNTEDYYLFKVYQNGVLATDSLHNYRAVDDRFFNGNELQGAFVQYFDEEKGEQVAKGDTITLEMAGITQEYYDFLVAVDRETSTKVPLFSGPPANIKGNISNGALGFFAVMEVDRGSTIFNGATISD
ncbi:DUF4249 domain-containing protein [Sunxiuqinia sp. sy24]|uniref:DUF4249 domain-containing protein n=1 Tax=Sunxiuqinia sp. sy24 TaxID=3461495 RepID=UPI0040458CF9